MERQQQRRSSPGKTLQTMRGLRSVRALEATGRLGLGLEKAAGWGHGGGDWPAAVTQPVRKPAWTHSEAGKFIGPFLTPSFLPCRSRSWLSVPLNPLPCPFLWVLLEVGWPQTSHKCEE